MAGSRPFELPASTLSGRFGPRLCENPPSARCESKVHPPQGADEVPACANHSAESVASTRSNRLVACVPHHGRFTREAPSCGGLMPTAKTTVRSRQTTPSQKGLAFSAAIRRQPRCVLFIEFLIALVTTPGAPSLFGAAPLVLAALGIAITVLLTLHQLKDHYPRASVE